jgi:hypothetical protein
MLWSARDEMHDWLVARHVGGPEPMQPSGRLARAAVVVSTAGRRPGRPDPEGHRDEYLSPARGGG